MMKDEKAMGHLLKGISQEVRNKNFHVQLKKIGATFLTHRELSAQGAVYHILSLPMKKLSRAVKFIDTSAIQNRCGVLHNKEAIEQLDDHDSNIFQKSLLDDCKQRPDLLETMCLAEFVASYKVVYKIENNDSDNDDALPPDKCDRYNKRITLQNTYGDMRQKIYMQ